jgi:DNA mismatch repair protein MutS2
MKSDTRKALELSEITAFFAQNAITRTGRQHLNDGLNIAPGELTGHFDLVEVWMDFLEHNEPFSIPALPDKRWFERNPLEKPLTLDEMLCVRDIMLFWQKIYNDDHIKTLLPMAEELKFDTSRFHELLETLSHAFGAEGWSPDLSEKLRKLHSEEDRLNRRLDHLLQDKIRQCESQLTETMVFERNGRRVLAVNKTFKRKIPGILQDYSTSGQTAFIEPDTSTPLQNRLQEIFFEKEEEIFRFRVQTTQTIAANPLIHRDLSKIATQLDVYQALGETALQTHCLPVSPNVEGILHLENARHPFLDEQFADHRKKLTGIADHNRMVPFTLILDREHKGLLISGANAGGKTVTLKTVGIISWLANHGYPVPADRDSQIPLYDHIFADIGDHQSLSHNLSTYASHLRHIRFILEQKDARCLILLDELGSGTDPMEGNALAQALIEECLNRDVHLLVTTHQQVLCSFALNESRLENASMTFDKHRLIPTYHFVEGVPGRSHALEIAQKTGLPESLLQRAQSLVDDNQMDIQQAIINLQEQSKNLEKQRRQFRKEERRAQRRISDTRQEREKLLRLQDELKEKEKTRIQHAVTRVEKEFRTLLKDVESRKTRQKLSRTFAAKQQELLPEENKDLLPETIESSSCPPSQWNTGDPVFLKSWHKKGHFLSLDRKNARVDVSGMTMTVSIDDLVHLAAEKSPSGRRKIKMYADEVSHDTVPFELKLIGKSREDALEEVRRTIDAAFLQHAAMLKIVHGHGHGILKKSIREFLERHPFRAHWDMTIDPENDGTTDLHFRWN